MIKKMLAQRPYSPEEFGSENSFTKVPTIDDFEFIKPISRGAFGKVFLGHKKGKPDKLYAIKAMKKVDMINKNLKDQVVTERDAMARSASPFVVQLYYSIQSQQNIFLVMEYLIGGDVKSLLSVAGFFDEAMAFMYTAEVTLALEYLHDKGIIHRDLKPDNMLITRTGHIKLTDFGLSKINMNFREVPMTPKTPMPYSQITYDDHRTPGQILSLRSSFAFSVKKEVTSQSYATTPSHWSGSSRNPLSDISENKTPHSKLMKSKSLREVVLSQSTTKNNPAVVPETPESVASTPPVKRLMSTLQDSLNWTKSSSEMNHSMSAKPSVKSSVQSCSSIQKNTLGLSFLREDNSCYSPSSVELSSDMYVDSTDISDSVFEQSCRTENSRILNSEHISLDNSSDAVIGKCTCNTGENNKTSCRSCRSHLKVPSRQETMTDETPQMHRSDESVWTSYAAKNLRSLREGEYSEDSEDSEDVDKENQRFTSVDEEDEKPLTNDFRRKCTVKSMKARKLVKAKSFSYPSDDELDCGSLRRFKRHKRFARKRSFQDVAQSPVRRTHSADSGLTQELRLFHLEPTCKRSNSFPRTRIRFNSGTSDTESKDKKSASQTKTDMLPKENLKQIVATFPVMAESENLSKLSKEESRQSEFMSFVMDGDSVSVKNNVNAESDSCDNLMSNHRPEKTEQENKEDNLQDSQKDLFHDIRKSDYQTVESIESFAATHKRVAALKMNMVSSLKSEGDMKMTLNSDLSSIHVLDSDFPSSMSYDMDTSVFTSAADSTWEKKFSSFSAELQSAVESKEPSPVSVPPTPPLLPPPPPKRRHSSGKKPPERLKSNSMIVPSTPEPIAKPRVMFHTPNLRYPRTPRTPLQKVLIKSHSFTAAMKTPFRTPKSVRRAPVPTEEERILGTPDYLAPEILEQKPHGKEVDWWALGVCLFEFLTGVPPFNDQTPDQVFENILNRDIPWPEGEEALSQEAQETIDALLTVDPFNRPGARAVRKMAAFRSIDWHNLLEMEAPFIPQPDDLTDTSYFEARNQMHDLFVSEVDF